MCLQTFSKGSFNTLTKGLSTGFERNDDQQENSYSIDSINKKVGKEFGFF
jgi:hypothetical protein